MTSPIAAGNTGLAPERTALAWNRTGMAFLVALGVLGRRVWPLDEGNHAWVLLVLGISGLTFLTSLVVVRRLATTARHHGETMDAQAFRLVSIATFVLAIAGFALALFPA